MHKIRQLRKGYSVMWNYRNESVDNHIFSVLKDRRDFINNQEKTKSWSVPLNFIFYQKRISSDSDDVNKQDSKLNWRAELKMFI